MSHFPVGQASSLATPFSSATPWSMDSGLFNANRFLAAYAVDVNMKVSGDTLMFTTVADRGYFMPLYVNVVCQNTFNNGVAVSQPVISIGFEAGNSYRNFVNLYGLEPAGQIGSGQWEKGSNQGGGFYDVWGLQLELSQFGRICPPSTGVYVRVTSASSGTTDVRTVSLLGIYTDSF